MLQKKDFYVNGEWIPPSSPNDFEVINPANEEAFAVISLGSKPDLNKAVTAARTAFQSWSLRNKGERIDLLNHWQLFTKNDHLKWQMQFLQKWVRQ